MITCPTCNGSGKIEDLSRVNRAGLNVLVPCLLCQTVATFEVDDDYARRERNASGCQEDI